LPVVVLGFSRDGVSGRLEKRKGFIVGIDINYLLAI
jgi:hypothetical protein